MHDSPKFAVGDRVKIVNAHSSFYGHTATVLAVRNASCVLALSGNRTAPFTFDEITPAPATTLSPLAQWAFRNRRDWSLNCRDTFGNGSERIVYVRKAACTYNRWSDAWIPAPGFNAGTDELEIVIPKAVSR